MTAALKPYKVTVEVASLETTAESKKC
jgi:hypothetical protein